MRTHPVFAIGKVTIHAKDSKSIWEIISDYPRIKIAYFFSVLIASSVYVVYAKEFIVRFTATCAFVFAFSIMLNNSFFNYYSRLFHLKFRIWLRTIICGRFSTILSMFFRIVHSRLSSIFNNYVLPSIIIPFSKLIFNIIGIFFPPSFIIRRHSFRISFSPIFHFISYTLFTFCRKAIVFCPIFVKEFLIKNIFTNRAFFHYTNICKKSVRFNNYGSGSHDPASAIFKVKVFK